MPRRRSSISSAASGGDHGHAGVSDDDTPRRSNPPTRPSTGESGDRPSSRLSSVHSSRLLRSSVKSGDSPVRSRPSTAAGREEAEAEEAPEEYGEDYEEDFDDAGVSPQRGHRERREASPTLRSATTPPGGAARARRSERREEEEDEEDEEGPHSPASGPTRGERRDDDSDRDNDDDVAEEHGGEADRGERRDADDSEAEGEAGGPGAVNGERRGDEDSEPEEDDKGQEEPDSGGGERRGDDEEDDEDFRRTGPRPSELRRLLEEDEATQRLLLQSQAHQAAVQLLDCAAQAQAELTARLVVAAQEQKARRVMEEEAAEVRQELEAREQALKAVLASTLNIERVKRGKLAAEEGRCRTDLLHAAQEEWKVLEEQHQKKASLRAIACKAVARSEEKARQALAGQAAQAWAALRKAAHEERLAIEESREAQARKEVDEVRQKLEAMQAEAAEKEKRRREREAAERELVRQQREEEERRRREKQERHAEEQRQRADRQRAQREAAGLRRQRREEELLLIREEQRKEEELQQQLERRARVLAMRAIRCQHEAEKNRRGVQERQVLRQIHGAGRRATRAEAWDQGSQASRQRSCSRADSARKKDSPDPPSAGGHGSSWDQPSPPRDPTVGKPSGLCTLPPLPSGPARPPPPKPRLAKNKAVAALPYLPEIFGDQNPLLRPAPFRPVGPLG